MKIYIFPLLFAALPFPTGNENIFISRTVNINILIYIIYQRVMKIFPFPLPFPTGNGTYRYRSKRQYTI